MRDAEKIVVLLDEQYYYDEKGYLRSRCSAEKYSSCTKTFSSFESGEREPGSGGEREYGGI